MLPCLPIEQQILGLPDPFPPSLLCWRGGSVALVQVSLQAAGQGHPGRSGLRVPLFCVFQFPRSQLQAARFHILEGCQLCTRIAHRGIALVG